MIDFNTEKKAEYVQKMFSAIVDKYDLLNTLLSLNRDKYWRKFTAIKSELKPGGRAIDVATGTGELAIELAKLVGANGKVVGVDFVKKMLAKAQEKIKNTKYEKIIEFIAQKAENLPFLDNTFDCATISFALRNVTDVKKTFEEMTRVVKAGGKVISLEFTQPKNFLFRKIYYFYILKVLPIIGGLVSKRKDAYVYLPNSVINFPSKEKLKKIMEDVGLKNIKIYNLTCGVVAIHIGIKP
ncbi:MAG: bifunctional demethylmenaquinone methyltransferase/2-methoxy-6-polyprenyl-1,4-benzoquinol methylase UbiE [Euryarchaeota archaeon]|nr:bifunctional demethylmenaquinone methyltransferase/2-methoxy-6-polyprenyl-1,4-benzoquinol methylase UbiE [Euryarchaeota archaeon]